ncbi:MAG TPA: creatininase family protein [Bdellovibrionota bacterium]|nr:creatininase family protein [Bdellovibrionota bacterium]
MYQFDKSILLDHLSWPQVEKKIKSGWTTIVLGIGSTEQHGPHLPLFVDAFCGDVIPHEVAKKLGFILQAPTIRVGCSEAHMGFPGTITISENTLKALIQEYCESLAKHGFQKIILIPTHGGNFKAVQEVAKKLEKSLTSTQVLGFADFDGLMHRFHEATEKFKVTKEEAGLHGGEIETSFMMHIAPEFVDSTKLDQGVPVYTSIAEVYKKGTKVLSPSGVLGIPLKANASKGKEYLAAYVDCVLEFIKKSK